jgi:hypothetical protein
MELSQQHTDHCTRRSCVIGSFELSRAIGCMCLGKGTEGKGREGGGEVLQLTCMSDVRAKMRVVITRRLNYNV